MAPKKPRACKHIDFLKHLKRCGKSKRAHLIGECDREQVLAVCECVDNILRGYVKPTTGQKQRLKKHVNVLMNLADTNIDWTEKKKFLKTQKGGAILTTVLGVALPALIQLFSSLISKK
jgi:hypothetical protein